MASRLMGQLALLAAVCVGFTIFGCSSEAVCPPGQAQCTCDEQGGCDEPLECRSNKCVEGTDGSAGGGPNGTGGASGQSGASGEDPVPTCLGKRPSPTAAGPCGCSADCDVGEACANEVETGFPGGSCVRSCNEDACPTGLGCVALSPESNVCLATCSAPKDCQAGHICGNAELAWKAGDPLHCIGFCQSDDDCPQTHSCDRYAGACSNSRHPGDGATGAPCESSDDCTSGFCFPHSDLTPGGICFSKCSVSKQGCPDGAVCDLATGDFGYCFAACTRVEDCRDGYACARAYDVGAWLCRGGGRIGDPCSEAEHCAEGHCLTDMALPAGYCSAACSREEPCPGDAVCSADVDGRCFARCAGATECRDGYDCTLIVDTGDQICLPVEP